MKTNFTLIYIFSIVLISFGFLLGTASPEYYRKIMWTDAISAISNLVMAMAAVYAAGTWVKQLIKAQSIKVVSEIHTLMYQLGSLLNVLFISSSKTIKLAPMDPNLYQQIESNRHATYSNALNQIRALYYTSPTALKFKFLQTSETEVKHELDNWMKLFEKTLSSVELNYSSSTSPNLKPDIQKLINDSENFYSKHMK